jgi:hypothetical protein
MSSFFEELLKDKEYKRQLYESLKQEKNREKDLYEYQKRFDELVKHYSINDSIYEILERTGVIKELGDYFSFTVTSRGELPPVLEIKGRNIKNNQVFPWIVSMKNLYNLNFSSYNEEKYPLVVETTARRLYRIPKGERLVSIDEYTTGSSLLYRLEILSHIRKIEEELNIEIIPEIEFINLATPYYYGDNFDDSLIRYLSKIRKKNSEKMKKILNYLNQDKERIKVKIINLKDPVIWQDNEEVYGKIIITYLPLPKVDQDYIKSFFRNNTVKQFKFYKELIDIHRKLTKEILNKVAGSKIVGVNGLYILSDQKLTNSQIKSLRNLILQYTKESQEKTKELLENYGVKNLIIEKLSLFKVKKGGKKEKKKEIAKWSDLTPENQRKTDENKLIRSGLRLLLNIK